MADQQRLLRGIVPSESARTFKECTAKINASDEFLVAPAEQPDPGPIINLNFLRYRPRGDVSRCNLYGGGVALPVYPRRSFSGVPGHTRGSAHLTASRPGSE
jgi:hypothetical protein